MPIRPSLSLAGLLLAVSPPLSAVQPGTTKGTSLSGCIAKQAVIGAKLKTVRSFANESQMANLEKTLSEVKEHCTGAGLLRENKQEVIGNGRKISGRKRDLHKTMGKGDLEETERRKAKPAEARVEPREAKEGLRQTQIQ